MYATKRRRQEQQHAQKPTGTRDKVEDTVDEHERYATHQQSADSSTTNSDEYSESNLPGKSIVENVFISTYFRIVLVHSDERTDYLAHILRDADLSYLIQLDRVQQVEYFLSERYQLIDEVSIR